jgi:hypothetical protein
MRLLPIALGSLILFGGSAIAEAKKPITVRGCVTANRACGWMLKMRSGLFYELEGKGLAEAAKSGTTVDVVGWRRGSGSPICVSRANAGSLRVVSWEFRRPLCKR